MTKKKIKWNWGTGIFLAIILFMLFIIVLVYQTMQQNYDLVEKDYYPKALEYQQQIDKETNAEMLTEQIKVENQNDLILLIFPSFFNPSEINGIITFYRPSDKKDDINIEIAVDSAGCQRISSLNLKKGKYLLKMDYQVNGKSYFQEEPVFVKMF